MGHPATVLDAERPRTLQFPNIFQPAVDDTRLTLRGCYLKFMQHEHRKPNTRSAYFTSLNKWERFTDDPPIGDLDRADAVLQQFIAALVAETSANNAAKNYRHIRAILNRMGPRHKKFNAAGVGLIDDVPYAPAPDDTPGEKRFIPRSQLSELYRACRVATWPIDTPYPAPLWWRGVLVIDSTYGLRPSDLVLVCKHHVGLRWSAVSRREECPDRRLNCRNKLGWITFTPIKTDEKKPQPIYLPITPAVAAVLDELEAINPNHGEESLIFPSGRSNAKFHETRKLICAAAKIEPAVEMQHLRQTAGDRWDRIRAGLGKLVLGHAARDVNAKHYRNPARPLARLVSRLKEPKAFLAASASE